MAWIAKSCSSEEHACTVRAGGFVKNNRVNGMDSLWALGSILFMIVCIGSLAMTRCLGNARYKHNSQLSAVEQIVIALPDVASRRLTSE